MKTEKTNFHHNIIQETKTKNDPFEFTDGYSPTKEIHVKRIYELRTGVLWRNLHQRLKKSAWNCDANRPGLFFRALSVLSSNIGRVSSEELCLGLKTVKNNNDRKFCAIKYLRFSLKLYIPYSDNNFSAIIPMITSAITDLGELPIISHDTTLLNIKDDIKKNIEESMKIEQLLFKNIRIYPSRNMTSLLLIDVGIWLI